MIRRVALFLLLTVGAFACVCHYLPIFVLSRVDVQGALPGQKEKYAALLGAEPGANLLDLDLKGWSERILAEAGVARVHVNVSLGGVARAAVELKRPVFLLDTRPVCGLSDRCEMLPLLYHPPDSTLPLISGIGGEPKYYEKHWSSHVRTAMAFHDAWREHLGEGGPRLSEIHVTPDGEVDAYLWPDRLLVRLGRGNWQQPMNNLKPILSHLGATERTLDLRFEGQVVESVQGET
jgi:hypothetical protein